MRKIRIWFSELSGISQVLVFALAVLIVGWVITAFCGKTYAKYYPNQQSSTVAISEFEKICGRGNISEADEFGVEFSQFYDSKGKAENSFMLLANTFHDIYSNGRFCHWYVLGSEKIYRCCDKNRKTIALRYVRHKGGLVMGSWEKPFYEIQFYVEK